jgi:hypothetical protein
MKEWVVGVTVLGLFPIKGFGISQAFITQASFLILKASPKFISAAKGKLLVGDGAKYFSAVTINNELI